MVTDAPVIGSAAMLHALLHGKLNADLRRDPSEIEDLLTSVVIDKTKTARG